MAQNVILKNSGLNELRTMNPALISYNVEMTEVTGGTFWKAYTEAQIDGTEAVPVPDFSKGLASMHQWYDPIDTTNPRLIKLAKDLGKAWVRANYPDCLVVGPCTCDPEAMKMGGGDNKKAASGIADILPSRTMLLNGKELTLGENDDLPCLGGEKVDGGTITVAPGGCTFILV